MPQLWQRAITASAIDGTDCDGGGGGGCCCGGETIVLSKEGGGGMLFNVACFCFANLGIISTGEGLTGIRGVGVDGLAATTIGSGGGGGGAGGVSTNAASGGAPGGAVGKFAAAFFTSLLADFSAPDAFSTGYIYIHRSN